MGEYTASTDPVGLETHRIIMFSNLASQTQQISNEFS